MANTIPNQPIVFNQSENCWLEDSGMNLLAEYGDLSQFQMKLEPCGSDVNVVRGGNFATASLWNVGAEWSIGGGRACHTIGSSGVIWQNAPASDGTLVRLTLTVEASDDQYVDVFWGSYFGRFTDGSYEVWIEADGATQFTISTAGSFAVCVRDLQMITVNTDFLVNIVGSDGSVVDSLDTSDGFFDFADGYFTCTIDWEGLALPNDCYTLQVVDPCYCGQRGLVATDLVSGFWNWSTAAVWTISGDGVADFSGSATGVALLANTVCSGITYEVTYTIENLSGTVDVEVGFGSTYGTARTANGTYTEQIISNGTSFRFKGTPTGAASFDIVDVSFTAIDADLQYDVSNVIKMQEGFNCATLALAMCNDSDAFGFGFLNTDFRPLMRIPASLTRSSYPMERLTYENSLGTKATYYGRSRKAKDLGFDGIEIMHDFAHLWLMCDHFYIDDVEYFVEEDEYPSISWGENDDVGGVTLVVSEKTQLIENRRLSSASVGCEPTGALILDDSGLPVLDSDDERITTP